MNAILVSAALTIAAMAVAAACVRAVSRLRLQRKIQAAAQATPDADSEI